MFFYDLGLSRLGLEHPTFRLRGESSNPLRHRRGSGRLRVRQPKKKSLKKKEYFTCFIIFVDSLKPDKILLILVSEFEFIPNYLLRNMSIYVCLSVRDKQG